MSNTKREQIDRLFWQLTDLLGRMTPDERLEVMQEGIEVFLSVNLIPWPEVVRMDPESPMGYARDMILDNETLYDRLGLLNQRIINRAMRARKAQHLLMALAAPINPRTSQP